MRRVRAAHQHGVLSRRRADPHSAAVPRGRRAEAVLPRDDGGGPERAQRARARHGGHRRREVLQRHRPRPQRAHARSTSARTRSCRWRGACTAASRAAACSFSRDRDIEFCALQPTEPEFQLAGDSERVAITCAALGVRADELELPVPLDRSRIGARSQLLEERGIVENGRLTRYGRAVEAMPVERAWAELLVNADDDARAVSRGDERRSSRCTA